jgi:hypothetical protein
MDSMIEGYVRELYARARMPTNEPCGALKLATTLFGVDCVRYVAQRALPGRAAVTCARTAIVIHLREGQSLRELNHSAAHELGEYHLHAIDYTGADPDELVGRIAAAVCVPRRAFHAARRALGEDIPALSRAFGVSESLMALRVGECLGRSTALITRNRIRTRGEHREWPGTRAEWRELVRQSRGDGLVLHRIGDARGRVALIAR